jgi:mannose-6-phosphate isomerase-like protein (cupin superfamily)
MFLQMLNKQVAMANPDSSRVRVIDSTIGCPEIPIVEGEGCAKVILSPHNGAKFRSFQLLALEHNARTIDLSHTADCVYYVIEGAGSVVDAAAGSRFDVGEGHMVHIDAGDRYRIEAGSAGIRVIGGPCPADANLYSGMTSGSDATSGEGS